MFAKRISIFILIAVLAPFATLSAQKNLIKFGVLDPAELQMEDCSFEPGAAAMVLYDYGEGSFFYDNSDGWMFKMKCFQRIKIFNKNGLDEANFAFRYYAGKSGDYETVKSLKGASYYKENGQIVRKELKGKKNTYISDLGNGYKEIRLALPAVREGSVVEYSYEIISQDISNIRNWYFQTHLPIQLSHYSLTVPEFFVFQQALLGSRSLDTSYMKNKTERYRINYGSNTGRSLWGDMVAGVNSYHWEMRDISAQRPEPFTTAQRDFSPHLEFQLIRVEYNNGQIEDIASDYSKFNTSLLESQYLGKAAKPDRYIKHLARTLTLGQSEPKARAAAILQHFQTQLTWDGNGGKYTSLKPSELFEKKTGTPADINLALTACFRSAGLMADPVILGTRDHGRPHPVFPNMDKFNYVVVAVDIDGQTVLADATDPDLPLGYVSKHCLNADGWRVSKNAPGWVPLKAGASASYTMLMELSPSNNQLVGKVQFSNAGYATIKALEDIREDRDAYLEELVQPLEEWNPVKPKYLTVDKADLKIQAETRVSKDLADEDMIFMEPVYADWLLDNPFTVDTRHSPVDFPYLTNMNYVLQMSLPEGYQVEEVPENMVLVFGNDRGLVFRYRCSIRDGQIMVISKLKMKRSFFLPEEYPDLRKFFDYVVAKNQEPIVLAKK